MICTSDGAADTSAVLMIWNLWCNQKTTVCLFVFRTISPAITVTGRVEEGSLGPIPAVFRCEWGYKQITSSWQDNKTTFYTQSQTIFTCVFSTVRGSRRTWEQLTWPQGHSSWTHNVLGVRRQGWLLCHSVTVEQFGIALKNNFGLKSTFKL